MPMIRTDADTSNRTRLENSIYVDGVRQDGTASSRELGVGRSSYIRHASQQESSNHMYVLVRNVTASQYLEVMSKIITAYVSTRTINVTDKFTLYAEYIPSTETVFTGTAYKDCG